MEEKLNKNFAEYKKQMELGHVPKAYRGLMEFMMSLRTHFKSVVENYTVGSFYQGYMDMTYFPVSTNSLIQKKLKLAIVFDHSKTQFEIWLSGQNRQVQHEYLNIIEQSELKKGFLLTKNPDSIIESIITGDPDFSDLDKLTTEIENAVEQFIKDVTELI
ncbi:DUF7000 family protein [Halocola ammonii]